MAKNFLCSRKVTSIVCLLLVSLFIVFVYAQEKPKSPQVSFEVSVKLKLFDVLALDENGNPVTDLKKDDFELLIDGKRWPIQTFDVKRFGKAQKEKELISPASNMYKAEMDDFFDKRLSLLVFHELRVLKKPREQMAKAVFSFLDEHFTKDDLIAVYYMKGSAILMLHPFTDDKNLLKYVIQKALVDRDYKIPFNWTTSPSFNFIPRFTSSSKGGDDKLELIPIEDGINDPWSAGNIEDFKKEQPRLHGIKASTTLVTSFHMLINSFALFKGRKEIYLLSDSTPFSFYRSSDNSWSPLAFNMFKKLTTDAMNNNVTINVLDMRKYAYQADAGLRRIDSLVDSFDRSGTESVPNEFLQGLAARTDGAYYWYCGRESKILEKLAIISEKSSNVYYLGAYIQDLEPEEKYDIEIKTNREDIKLVYHSEFRTRPEYEEMDDVDRKIHFLEAFYGSYPFNNFPFKSEILQFPYGKNQTLALTLLKPNEIEETSSKYDAAVRYFNTDTMNDSQEVQSWDIKEALTINKIQNFQVILGSKVVDDEYIYRHVMRDSDTGAISNARGKVKLGLKDRILSSIIFFTDEPSILKLINLLNRKEEQEDEDNDKEKVEEFIFEPSLNPFIYDDKILTMSINHPIDATKPLFIMYMYNQDMLTVNSYVLNTSLLDENGEVIPISMKKAFPETEFPGGWRRMTIDIPRETFLTPNSKYKFKVEVIDKSGKIIEQEERIITVR